MTLNTIFSVLNVDHFGVGIGVVDGKKWVHLPTLTLKDPYLLT